MWVAISVLDGHLLLLAHFEHLCPGVFEGWATDAACHGCVGSWMWWTCFTDFPHFPMVMNNLCKDVVCYAHKSQDTRLQATPDIHASLVYLFDLLQAHFEVLWIITTAIQLPARCWWRYWCCVSAGYITKVCLVGMHCARSLGLSRRWRKHVKFLFFSLSLELVILATCILLWSPKMSVTHSQIYLFLLKKRYILMLLFSA